jgi:hypothetical protein
MKTPIELLLHEIPDYTFLKVFGCACWPHLRPYNSRKLEFRSKKCVFLGYSSLHKGYNFMYQPIVSTYHEMLFLMRMSSHFLPCHNHPLAIHSCIHPPFCLANLKMLHMRLCCCLIMVQVLVAEHAWSFFPTALLPRCRTSIRPCMCMPRVPRPSWRHRPLVLPHLARLRRPRARSSPCRR